MRVRVKRWSTTKAHLGRDGYQPWLSRKASGGDIHHQLAAFPTGNERLAQDVLCRLDNHWRLEFLVLHKRTCNHSLALTCHHQVNFSNTLKEWSLGK
ncbi:hypothetical protein MHYP_G00078100 [Metynnis hypsauchen]